MKKLIFTLLLLLLTATPCLADNPSPLPTITNAPQSMVSPTPLPAPSTTPVATPAAPPAWAQEIMVTAEKLPVVGPIVSKTLLYLGIVSSILTMLVCFLLAAINTVAATLNSTGLLDAAAKLQAFKNGKVMYWIKFFSMFNAKPAASPPSSQS